MQEYSTREIGQRFELLVRYERRCVIHFLQETQRGHAPMGDVVNHLQKQDPTPDEHDKIVSALHHIHLPKLATLDVLDFDSHSGTVRYHGDELVEALLESTPETYIPSP